MTKAKCNCGEGKWVTQSKFSLGKLCDTAIQVYCLFFAIVGTIIAFSVFIAGSKGAGDIVAFSFICFAGSVVYSLFCEPEVNCKEPVEVWVRK